MTEHEGAPEGTGASQPPAGQPSTGDAMQKAVQGMMGAMTATEQLIVLATGVFLVVNLLIGDLITDDWGASYLSYILALGALLAILRHGRGHGRWHEFYPWVVEVMAGAFATIVLIGLLYDLFRGFDYINGGADWFYSIVYWAVGAALGYGAWQLHTAHD